jgi:hypothetical protein
MAADQSLVLHPHEKKRQPFLRLPLRANSPVTQVLSYIECCLWQNLVRCVSGCA